MKILHAWVFYNESLRYHVHFLAEEQARLGHEVSVVGGATVKPQWIKYSADPRPRAGVFEVDGYRLFRIPVQGPASKPVASLGEIRKVIEKVSPDVVHVFGMSQVFSIQVLEVLRRHFPKIPVVVNDHSNPTRVAPGALGRLYYAGWSILNRRYKRQIKRLVAPNSGSAELLRRRYPYLADRVSVLPLGYDQRTFHTGAGERNNENALIVGFAGKIDSAKRVDRLIWAIGAAGLESSVRCVIAGAQSATPEHLEYLKALADSAGVLVDWRPFLGPAELAELYAWVDLACFPGSISITTLEATGAGAPVLVWRSIPGLEDRVSNGRGSLFDSDEELIALLHKYVELKRAGGIDHQAIAAASRPQAWSAISVEYNRVYMEVSS